MEESLIQRGITSVTPTFCRKRGHTASAFGALHILEMLTATSFAASMTGRFDHRLRCCFPH